jgi:PleD family two-component response regulator
VPSIGTSKGWIEIEVAVLATAFGLRGCQQEDEDVMEFITIGTERKTTSRPTRSFFAVSDEQQQEELLGVLVADEHDYGVVFVERIARSYSRIKEVVPDVVIVDCAIDDLAACLLLSMLKLDASLSHVRVVTCANAPSTGESADFMSEMLEAEPAGTLPLQMN